MFKAKQNFGLRKKLCNAPVIMQIDNILWKIDQPPPPPARTRSCSEVQSHHLMLVLSSAHPNQESPLSASWQCYAISLCFLILINAELTVTMADTDLTPAPPSSIRGEAGYTGMTLLPSTNNTIPGLKKDLWPLQIRGKWLDIIQGANCVHWDNSSANMIQCLLGSVRRRVWEVWWSLDGFTLRLKMF